MASSNRKNSTGVLYHKKNKELWAALEPNKFKEYLIKNDTYKTDSKWSLKGGVLQGRCRAPEHAGKDIHPSMIINLKKGYSKCHTCGHYEHDLGRILGPITGKDPKVALKEIQSHFNIKVYKSNDFKDSEVYSKHVSMKNQLAKVFNHDLVAAIDLYREGTLKDSELFYAENMIAYLEKRDPLILDYASNLPLGIFVSSSRLTATARSLGISGSYIESMKEYLSKNMVEYYIGALVLVYHETMTDVSRFRLRLQDSVDETGKVEKVIRAIADPHTPDLGIFGLGHNAGVMGVQNKNPIALMCEGEFDALAVMVNQMHLNDPSWIPLCHSGNAASGKITALESTPIRKVMYVPDHDSGGINNTKLLLSNNHTLDISIFNWPLDILVASAPSTDLSDSISAYGFTKVNSALRELTKNYASREAWAKHRVTTECRGLDVDIPADFAAIKEIAQEYAACIGSITDHKKHEEVKKWLSDVLTNAGVSAADITSITVSASTEDDPEQEFISLISITLDNDFHFVAYEPEDRKITIWDKKKRNISFLRTSSEAGLKTDIGNTIGDLKSWVIGEVPGGLPGFVKYVDREEKQKRSYVHIDTMLGDFIRLAIRGKTPNLKELSSFEKYTRGVHWLDTSNGKQLFNINGNHVYKGYFSPDGDLFWEELSVPVYEKYYFDLSKPAWSENFDSVQNLRNAPDIPLAKLLERNMDIINIGWTFQNQKPEVDLLGAWATLVTIAKIFPSNMQFLASNERSCGKSALYAECFGGGKGTSINITEHTHYADNITPAGMKQMMDGAALPLILDEFDNQSGMRGTQEKQEEVMTMLRTSSGGDGIFIQGTTTGKPRVYRFSVSTMLAGIDPSMTEANQTRLITTDLKSGLDGRLPPQASILAKYSAEEIRETRMWNTLSTFKHIPSILSAYSEITTQLLEDPDMFGKNIMQRFKDSLVKLLSVFKAAYPGTDIWKEVGTRICNAKKAKLATLKDATANADLVDAILYTVGVEVSSQIERRTYSLIQLLSSGEIAGDQSTINQSNAGVWLQPSLKLVGSQNVMRYYLFIQWKNISSTLFKFNSRWKQPPAQLKTIASRHCKILKDHEAEAIYRKEKAIPGWVGGSGTGSYSVLDVTDYIEEGAKRQQEYYDGSTSNEYINSLPTAEAKVEEADGAAFSDI